MIEFRSTAFRAVLWLKKTREQTLVNLSFSSRLQLLHLFKKKKSSFLRFMNNVHHHWKWNTTNTSFYRRVEMMTMTCGNEVMNEQNRFSLMRGLVRLNLDSIDIINCSKAFNMTHNDVARLSTFPLYYWHSIK